MAKNGSRAAHGESLVLLQGFANSLRREVFDRLHLVVGFLDRTRHSILVPGI